MTNNDPFVSAPSSADTQDSTSPSNKPASENPRGSSNGNPTSNTSSANTTPASPSTATSPPPTSPSSNASTSSPEASPARTSASPESKKAYELALALACGLSSRARLARYDPATSSLKTFQLSLGMDWIPFSATLPRSGMMQSGVLFQLPPLAPLTGATGSSLLPTPTASDGTSGSVLSASDEYFVTEGGALRKVNRNGIEGNAGLGRFALLFPTPAARDWKDSGSPAAFKRNSLSLPSHAQVFPTPTRDADRVTGYAQGGTPLGKVVRMYPTPRASDSTGGYVETELAPDGGYRSIRKASDQFFGAKLQDAVRFEEDLPTGKLNPAWVELLMGVPLGWTELAPGYADAYVAHRKALSRARRMKTAPPEPLAVVDAEPVSAPPTRSWSDDWEEGVPRLSEGTRFRKERLMALGNGVVPAWGRIPVEFLRLLERARK